MTPLEEACAISLKRWVDSLPDNIEPYQFSKKHERRMKVLFNKMRGGRYHYLTTKSTVVLVAAILIFAMAITAMAIPYTREFIIEKFFDHSTYTVVGGEYSEIGDIEIGYIPEGFEKVDEYNGKSSYRINYKSKDANDWFDIRVSQNTRQVLFDTEKYKADELKYNSQTYICYYDKELNHYGLIWNKDTYIYRIAGSIDIEQEIRIAESIKGS